MVIGTSGYGNSLGVLVVDHEHLHGLDGLLRTHHADELGTVDHRHFPIDDDHVRHMPADGLEPGIAVFGLVDGLHADRSMVRTTLRMY